MARQLSNEVIVCVIFPNMKSLLTLLGLSLALTTTAQTFRRSTTHTQIDEDGKTLSVQVEGLVNGQPINYRHTFDVARLDRLAKDDLKHRIFDSLGIGNTPEPPRLPATPPGRGSDRHRPAAPADQPEEDISSGESATDPEQNVTFRCETCTGKVRLVLTRSTDDYSFERTTSIDGQKRFFPNDIPLPPGEYRLQYSQNDVLQIQSTFTVKVNQKNTVVVK